VIHGRKDIGRLESLGGCRISICLIDSAAPWGRAGHQFPSDSHALPRDWFLLADPNTADDQDGPFYLATRRAAEDAAALAFAKLPAECRAELLAGKGAEPTVAAPKRKPKPKKKPKGKK
jgi:hypothetical protein